MPLTSVDRSLSMPAPGVELSTTGVAAAAKPRPAAVTNLPADSTVVTMSGRAVASPDKPSATTDLPNRDWTAVKVKATAKEPVEPPKEPISKQLLNHLHSVWLASASAVDMAQASVAKPETAEQMKRQRNAEQLSLYADLKIKRSDSVK